MRGGDEGRGVGRAKEIIYLGWSTSSQKINLSDGFWISLLTFSSPLCLHSPLASHDHIGSSLRTHIAPSSRSGTSEKNRTWQVIYVWVVHAHEGDCPIFEAVNTDMWLPGVWLRHSVHIEDCEGWGLPKCRSSVAEHWLHKPGVLGLATATLFTFLYVCLKKNHPKFSTSNER